MSAEPKTTAPLRILILALGGEGGGVLMNWIVDAARASGRHVQATSVPGVAQRTGSTNYYIEISNGDGDSVLGLMPMPGRVDVVLASELVEAARSMEQGFISPKITTLIASTNRVYATSEKIDMGDGRFDGDRIVAAAGQMAKTAHLLDFDEIARNNGTLISATLFGALAGSGVLPWDPEVCERIIGEGRSAASSRKGFAAAFDAVRHGDGASKQSEPASAPNRAGPEVIAGLPEPVRETVRLGHERVCDYQDAKYGSLYLERVDSIVRSAGELNHLKTAAVEEACRRLALWMAYEDIARVADLKTRAERFATIRDEVKLVPGQLIRITEYMKPRTEELADMLPVALGRRIMARVEAGKSVPLLGRPIRLQSNGVVGYWVLRAVASLRGIRPRSLRFVREQAAIDRWLSAICASLPNAPGFSEALASLPRLRKGYSDTMERGIRAYHRIFDGVILPLAGSGDEEAAAGTVRGAIAAALADDTHGKLDAFLADLKKAQLSAPERRKVTAHAH